jgi:hypothetical protein
MDLIQQPPKFKTVQELDSWMVQFSNKGAPIDGETLLGFRRDCYKKIESIRKRPLIVYASKFWDIPPGTPVSIDLSDIELFVDLVNSIPSGERSLDVLVHSSGGAADVTERIVGILRARFEEVHFLIPHSAYSAATMLALSGNSILMHPNAVLGPIDPQFGGTPGRSIQRGFEKIKQIIKKEGVESLPAYIPLLEKYSIHLLEMCEDAEKLSRELVSIWLKQYMFKNNEKEAQEIAINAAKFFSDYDTQLLHSRPLTFDKVQHLGLNIEVAQGTLKDLLWESFVLINGLFKVSPFVKLYENVNGITFGRSFSMIPQPQMKRDR